MRSIVAVTTFNSEGWDRYGRRMVESFDRLWPQDVTLYVYFEKTGDWPTPEGLSERIVWRDLNASCPGLVAFKNRHGTVFTSKPMPNGYTATGRNEKHYNYRFDAVRFSHKVFAILHAAESADVDLLYWIDADTVTFADVPREKLEAWTPASRLAAYLGRVNMYSECGFVGYNRRHPAFGDFIAAFRRMYEQDELFRLPEWHDSFIFDAIRKHFESRRGAKFHDLSPGYRGLHPWLHCELGSVMDHMKGPDRKAAGHSFASDLSRPRPEPYWRGLPKERRA